MGISLMRDECCLTVEFRSHTQVILLGQLPPFLVSHGRGLVASLRLKLPLDHGCPRVVLVISLITHSLDVRDGISLILPAVNVPPPPPPLRGWGWDFSLVPLGRKGARVSPDRCNGHASATEDQVMSCINESLVLHHTTCIV